MHLIEVPRPQLDVFLAMPESEQVAVYFLFGHSDDGAEPKVYIGQTGDLRKRLASHNKDKDFWQRALVLISRTGSLTQTHALFLEWQCIQAARQAGRYVTENGNAGTRPHTPAPLEADCMEIFDTGRTHGVVEGDVTVFTEDVLFASPSSASAVVCAAASNGWLDWKTARGETLSEVKRGGESAVLGISSACA